MILHDSTFEALASAPVKQTDVQVARQIFDPYGVYDDTLIWASSDVLMSVKIDSVGTFLGTATKKATVQLLGIVDTVATGDTFQVRLGIFDIDPGEQDFNYISQGFFIVDTIEFNYEAGSTTVTMYDAMHKAHNTQYKEASVATGFEYPSTVTQLAEQMAAAIGTELMPGFSALPNADFTIQVDPYANISNATLQTVINEIASATGTTARVSDNTLVFSEYSIGENLTSVNLKSLKIGDKYGPVTSVVLGRVPQNDNIVISSVAPEETIISLIDPVNNLITVAGNAMVDGNLVRVESDDTLPAPLQPDTNYYVFTNGSTDTFALAETYADAVAGTNLIDLTSAGSGTIRLSHIQTQEVQINNNQIVDDDREELLPDIYAKLVGIEWHEVESETTGLGWHEVGDVIQFTQGSTTVNAFISEIHLTLAGSIKESIVSEVPDIATINYQTAGGIIKTIYNTEIKVDKQENEISSVVSQQDVYENETQDNFTELYQNLENILLTIQKSGGGNLISNSVGFARESTADINEVGYDKLLYWDYNTNYDTSLDGTVVSYSSSASQNQGGVSGQVIEMVGTDVSITQHVPVAAGSALSFAFRVNNAIGTGSATITLANDIDSYQIDVDNVTDYDWQEIKLEDFTTSLPWLDITISVNNATGFAFTDLRLLYGNTAQGWVQSASEMLSANVQFTKDGMRIFDSVHDTETRVTYNEFSTRRKEDGTILFEADDSGIITNNLSIKGKTSYMSGDETVIRQITIPSSSTMAGIAFIKVA